MAIALPVHRGPIGLPRHLARAVAMALAKTLVLGIFVAVLASIQVAQQVEQIGSQELADQVPAHLTSLMTRYRCSTTGFGDRVVPRAAIVRRGSDSVRVVSFARGWRLHEQRPSALVAVCLRAPHAATAG